MMPTGSDPWGPIAPPDAAGAINALRVDAGGPWDFFWARDLEGRRLLVLFFSSDLQLGRLPHPAGIEVTVRGTGNGHRSMLALALLDAAHRDIFHQLCLDIVSSASTAVAEAEALAVAVSRTWRWHHLLRGGGEGRLSREEQKGLIGELLVLERHLLPAISPMDAVSAWVGPLGAPKDFEVGTVCIEAKARRGTAAPFISISSEFQLDTHGTDAFFLHVVDLATAVEAVPDAFTVSDIAERVIRRVASLDQCAIEQFESLLCAAGFRWTDDYGDCLWAETSSCLYEVVDEFPRLSAEDAPLGVSSVRYSLALAACAPFEVTSEQLGSAIGGHSIG